jgi:hypothetical protein
MSKLRRQAGRLVGTKLRQDMRLPIVRTYPKWIIPIDYYIRIKDVSDNRRGLRHGDDDGGY